MISKKDLRKYYIDLRNGFDSDYRNSADRVIAEKLINTSEYNDSSSILIYISVDNEVDTKYIIDYSLSTGKTVAIPFCKNNEMNFYRIRSFDDLTRKQFGIPTVDPENALLITDFDDALCIVPALSFDSNGNRLGYGGGYYDRFLSDKHIKSIGLCREKQMSIQLPSEKFDVKINTIITENKIFQI